MKLNYFILLAILFISLNFFGQTHMATNIWTTDAGDNNLTTVAGRGATGATLSLVNNIPNVRIFGLGGLANVEDTLNARPSANVGVDLFLNMPFIDVVNHPQADRALKLSLNANFGAELDSTILINPTLSDFALYDNNRLSGSFIAGFDILRCLPNAHGVNNIRPLTSGNGFAYSTLDFVYEASMFRKNLRNPNDSTDLFILRTRNVGIGLRYWHHLQFEENLIALQVYPYVRWTRVPGTYVDEYQALLFEDNKGENPPAKLNFWGVNMGVQFNKVYLGITYEAFVNKQDINNQNLLAGTFLFRINVSADFIKL